MVRPDASLRAGVVSMSHAWGSADDAPDAVATHGACTNRLICDHEVVEPINAMPRMSAIPVAISAA